MGFSSDDGGCEVYVPISCHLHTLSLRRGAPVTVMLEHSGNVPKTVLFGSRQRHARTGTWNDRTLQYSFAVNILRNGHLSSDILWFRTLAL